MNIEKTLSQKIGPFPGYVWAVLVAAGGFVLYKVMKGSSSSSPTSADATTGTQDQGVPGGIYYGGTPPPQPGPYPGPGGAPVPLPVQPGPSPWPGGGVLPVTTGSRAPVNQSPSSTSSRGAVNGTGGPSVGSRSADITEEHHPHVGRRVIYPHFVRVGGASSREAHVARVQAIAGQVGVHPARLLALNPDPRAKVVRIA